MYTQSSEYYVAFVVYKQHKNLLLTKMQAPEGARHLTLLKLCMTSTTNFPEDSTYGILGD